MVEQNSPESTARMQKLVGEQIDLGRQIAADCRLFAVELETLAISYGDPA
ncbi:hypothetical protein [Mesorhizobium prunaredense]|nr:hypothetical protein [Mesorhizobium prunaredense]